MDNLALVVEGHSALNRILPPSSVWGVTRPRDRKRKLVQRPKWIEGINRCHPLQTFGYQRVPNDDLLLRGSRGKKWIDNDLTVLRRVNVDRVVADRNPVHSGE